MKQLVVTLYERPNAGRGKVGFKIERVPVAFGTRAEAEPLADGVARDWDAALAAVRTALARIGHGDEVMKGGR